MIKKTVAINGKDIIFQTGRLAPQAEAAVVAQMGGTVVLATAALSPLQEEIDYFPLQVEYQEKLYAGGIIKGSRWVKREGRPSDEAILIARLIDRSVRPLFPSDFKMEVQIIVTTLSFDGENNPDILALNAASACLAISSIPWNGPIGGIRIGLNNENDFLINPSNEEMENSKLNLIVSSLKDKIVMIEAGGRQIPEKKLIEGVKKAEEVNKEIINIIEQLRKEVGKEKLVFAHKKPPKISKEIEKKLESYVKDLLKKKKNSYSFADLNPFKESAIKDKKEEDKKKLNSLIDEHFKKIIRKRILQKKQRLDGRKPEDIRPLSLEVGILPRTHGSALFQRGLTQALTIVTLGSPSLEQWIESIEGEETKRYIHHYYMPPFSVGETGRLGWPSRREVGHGALAERALEAVIPNEEKFPYTIRVVSEIMSSNGSTSMAAVCGSSLALMDAGVPIETPVAGIAMGLVLDSKTEKYVVLTDIMGIEDHLGDMDFKVAGTNEGITALQMDVKIAGIKSEILTDCLEQAYKARLFILKKMKETLPAPRASVSPYAPKVAVLYIDKNKIGDIIGPGGRTIRQIIAETQVSLDVNDEGKVTISSLNKENINSALALIEGLTREIQVGEEFEGIVKRIQPFGIFVEVLPGKEGLVHISKMSTNYVNDPHEIIQIGQKVKVKVDEIDEMGRINLTMLLGKESRKTKAGKNNYQYYHSPNFQGAGGYIKKRQKNRRDFQKRNKKKEFTSYFFEKRY